MDELIAEFTSLGCPSIKESALCAHMYLELTEIKRYWNVTYKYNENLGKMYCMGSKTRKGKLAVFIAVCSDDHLSFEQMQQFFGLLTTEKNKSLFLFICAKDSTSVFYEMANGIGPKLVKKSPEQKRLARVKQMRQKVLRKNINILKEAAMCNVPVTLTRKQQGLRSYHYRSKSKKKGKKSRGKPQKSSTKVKKSTQDSKPSTSKQ